MIRSDLFDMNTILQAIKILIQSKQDLYYIMNMVSSLIFWEKTKQKQTKKKKKKQEKYMYYQFVVC